MRFRSIVNPLIYVQRIDGGLKYRFDLETAEHVYMLNAAQLEAFSGTEIVDLDGLVQIVRDFFKEVLGGYALKRPQVRLYLPYSLSSIQKKAYQQVFRAAGAHSVDIAYRSHEYFNSQSPSFKSGVLLWLDAYGSELLTVYDSRVIGTLALRSSSFNVAQAVIQRLKRSDRVRDDSHNIDLIFDFLAKSSARDRSVRLLLRNGEEKDFDSAEVLQVIGRVFDQSLITELLGAIRKMPMSVQTEVARKGVIIAGDPQLVDLVEEGLEPKVDFSIVKAY